MIEDLEVERATSELMKISTDSRVYTFEATRRASGRCHMKVTVSTKDLSPHPSLTTNPGRHEIREKESDTFQNCLNSMHDHVKEDRVMEEAGKWVKTKLG